MEEMFLNFIDKASKVVAYIAVASLFHVALRVAEAFEKGLL